MTSEELLHKIIDYAISNRKAKKAGMGTIEEQDEMESFKETTKALDAYVDARIEATMKTHYERCHGMFQYP